VNSVKVVFSQMCIQSYTMYSVLHNVFSHTQCIQMYIMH